MTKTALVTGVAGFIGSKLSKKLISDGYQVVGIDNLSTGYIENVPRECKFIRGDVQNPETLTLLDGFRIDVIFHIAGQSSGEISFLDPVYDLQTNTQSTVMLLEFARKTACNNFVYAGSMSVYGNPLDPHKAVSENYPTDPLSFYATGKIASESYMKIYAESYGIRTTVLRLFNVYGPGQNMQNLKQGMVSIFIAQAINFGKLTVKGSLDRFRDQVFIDDVVRAFLKAATYEDNCLFNVFNICTGKPIKVSQVITEIEKYILIEDIVEESGTPGDQFGIIGDPSLSAERLNFIAGVEFQAGFEEMIDFIRNEKI